MSIDFTALAVPGVQGLHPYQPGKPIEELQRELGLDSIVKLASNENPLGPSPRAVAAARAALDEIHRYPDDNAHRLRHKLAARLGVAPESLLFGNGSSDVIDMVARSFLGPGRNAVYAEHSFAMYAIYTRAAGAEGRVAPALPADHPDMPLGHDLDALRAAIDADTRVLFIANPNNPTGTWLGRAALHDFLRAVPPEVVVVLDEAYTEYVEAPDFPDGLAWLGEFPNLIVTRTFSKIHGLAGLRVGYGVAGPALASLVARVRHPFNVNSAALAAAEAALDDAEHVARSVALNRAGLRQLGAGLAALGLRVLPSVGNFLCVDLGRPAGPVFDGLLRRGVIVRPVANYGLPNHLRISVGTAEENDRCLAALAEVLA